MKIQELNEIVEFFGGRQGTDEGKAEYYKVLLQSEQIRIMSEIRKGLRNLGDGMKESSDNIVDAIENRLWPLVSLYDMEENEKESEEDEQARGQGV